MAALMRLRNVFVFTHDSIGLGEDGPTHQSIEHAASLRLIPNFDVWRPGDSVEIAVAWTCALARRDGPTALPLSRQNVAFQARSQFRNLPLSDTASAYPNRSRRVFAVANGGSRHACNILLRQHAESCRAEGIYTVLR
jgi:transketolase